MDSTTNGHTLVYQRTSIEDYCGFIDRLKEKNFSRNEINISIHALRTATGNFFKEKYGTLTFEHIYNFVIAVKTYGLTAEGKHSFTNTASLLRTMLSIHEHLRRETLGKSLDDACMEAEIHHHSLKHSTTAVQRRELRTVPVEL